MKRIFAIIFLTFVLFSVNGFAENNFEVSEPEKRGREIFISGTAEPGTYILIKLDTQETTINQDKVIGVVQARADEEGAYRVQINVPDMLRDGETLMSADGVELYYTVGSFGNINGAKKGSFIYYKPITADEAAENLKNAESTESVLKKLKADNYADVLENMGMIDLYKDFDDSYQKKLAGFLFDNRADLNGNNLKNTLIPELNEKVLAYALCEADNKEEVSELLNNPDLDYRLSQNSIFYEDMEEDEIEVCFEKLSEREFENFEDVAEAVDSEHLKVLIENTVAQDMHEFLDDYTDILKISEDTYESIDKKSQSAKTSIYKTFKKNIAVIENPVFSDFERAYEDAVDDAPKSSGSSGGGGGSSSGGGGNKKNGATPITGTVMGNTLQSQYSKEDTPPIFKDTENYGWAVEAIETLYDFDIMKGTSLDTFEPGRNITRAEAIKTILLAFNLASKTTAGEDAFSDVPEDTWYYYYVYSARAKGITNGYEDGTFRPNENITREELATFFYRASIQGKVNYEEIDKNKVSFTDYETISDYAKEYVMTFAQHGIMNGKGNGMFAPQDNATRAETAVMVYRLLSKVGLLTPDYKVTNVRA